MTWNKFCLYISQKPQSAKQGKLHQCKNQVKYSIGSHVLAPLLMNKRGVPHKQFLTSFLMVPESIELKGRSLAQASIKSGIRTFAPPYILAGYRFLSRFSSPSLLYERLYQPGCNTVSSQRSNVISCTKYICKGLRSLSTVQFFSSIR